MDIHSLLEFLMSQQPRDIAFVMYGIVLRSVCISIFLLVTMCGEPGRAVRRASPDAAINPYEGLKTLTLLAMTYGHIVAYCIDSGVI